MDPTEPQQPPNSPNVSSFAYRAQTHDGQAISGTLDADSSDEARSKLASLGLRLMEISMNKPVSLGPTRLGTGDFLAFNQQLAQLSAAGLPVEHGLKLIAQDLRRGKLAKTIDAVTAELDRGRSLPEAFEAHRAQFPPFYSNLIDAGIRSNNLPAMLTNLGRHVELTRHLRVRFWQTLMYPVIVLAAIIFVLLIFSTIGVPHFTVLYEDFGTDLPVMTKFMLKVGRLIPYFVAALVICVALLISVWFALRRAGWDRHVIDRIVRPMPLVGAILRRHLLARWCDALRLGIDAGQPLPQAIELASDALSWPGLSHDGRALLAQLVSGQRMEYEESMWYLTPSVCAVINHAGQRGQLSESLASLTDLQQKQADVRIEGLLAFLGPACLIILGGLIFLILITAFLPLIKLIQAVA